ncbi:hypothetical protein SDC9_151328 [bioreactor metagenome]|uniref:Uncharacterized protein n=1 Tax=bioreactor metagenome TaxID=1076179 RepID=A0A645ES27_9ZZZZ
MLPLKEFNGLLGRVAEIARRFVDGEIAKLHQPLLQRHNILAFRALLDADFRRRTRRGFRGCGGGNYGWNRRCQRKRGGELLRFLMTAAGDGDDDDDTDQYKSARGAEKNLHVFFHKIERTQKAFQPGDEALLNRIFLGRRLFRLRPAAIKTAARRRAVSRRVTAAAGTAVLILNPCGLRAAATGSVTSGGVIWRACSTSSGTATLPRILGGRAAAA